MVDLVCVRDGAELLPSTIGGEWYCPECLTSYQLAGEELVLTEEYQGEEDDQ